MREVKFKGKVLGYPLEYEKKPKREGDWVCGYLIKLQDGRTLIIEEPRYEEFEDEEGIICGSGITGEVYEIDPKTVRQYTEEKDKNNKEIYGGDIISYTYLHLKTYGGCGDAWERKKAVGDVKFIKGKWMVSSTTSITQRRYYYNELYKDCDDIEVIGNIYENSGLLKKKGGSNE